MSSRPHISGENENISNSGKSPMNTSIIQTEDNWDKFRERSKTRWHPSKLEGYVSDEFRSVEFAD